MFENPTPDPTLVPVDIMESADYYAALAAEVSQAGQGDVVDIATMSFEPNDPQVDQLLTALGTAAANGASVNLAVDAYALLLESTHPVPGPLWAPLPSGQELFRRRQQALASLHSHPTTQATVINQPSRLFSSPVAGRNHIKISRANDRVYLPNGNLNLTDDNDMVLALTESRAASWLGEIVADLAATGHTLDTLSHTDEVFPVDHATELIVDAGIPGQSLILDEALALIDEAEDWLVLATQYYPQKEVLRRLTDAVLRGVDVRLPYNTPASQGLLEKLPERLSLFRSRKVHSQLRAYPLPVTGRKMHLKGLASEKQAMAGSHNYIERGVRSGTAELVLRRRDAAFARRAGDFMLKQAGLPSIEDDTYSLTAA